MAVRYYISGRCRKCDEAETDPLAGTAVVLDLAALVEDAPTPHATRRA
jgi:hypothetical protein